MKPVLQNFVLTLLASAAVLNIQCAGSQPTAPAFDSPGQKAIEIDHRIWAIYQSVNNDLWFGSNGKGVYRFDGNAVTHFTSKDGLIGDNVRDIRGDTNGNIFVSTNSGVSMFDGTSFTSLEIIELASPDIGWELNSEDVWIMHRPGELGPLRFDGDKLYALRLQESPEEYAWRARYPRTNLTPAGVTSIYTDRRGHIWIGTSNVGLCRYDGVTLSWMHEEHLTTTPSGGNFGIRSIYEDSAGSFWIGNTRHRFSAAAETVRTYGHSLLDYESHVGLPAATNDDDKHFNYIFAMTEDKTGALWFACGSDGVWKYDGENVTRYPVGDDAIAFKILCDDSGTLWIGTTEQGLFKFDGSEFKPFRVR